MNILITGGTGFIGRHFVEGCRRGHEVVVVGRGTRPLELHESVIYQRWIADHPDTLLPSSMGEEPFVLVHLAWDLSRSADYATQAHQVAVLAGLLDYWSTRGLSYVIGIGSAAEFGTRCGRLSEHDPPEGTLSAYGWGKRSAGSLLAHWSAASDIASLWLRPFVVYGPGQQGNMAIPYAIRQAAAGQGAEFTDGHQQRDLVYVSDIVEALLAAIERPLDGFHTINLGAGQGVPMCDVLRHLGGLLAAGSLFHFGARARRPGEPEQQIADVEAARRLLDWEARVGWQDGLQRLVEATKLHHRRSA